jgi:hypothetical protein
MASVTTRLRNPAFGTEATERNLMQSAADAIDSLASKFDRLTAQIEMAGKIINAAALDEKRKAMREGRRTEVWYEKACEWMIDNSKKDETP